MVWNNLNVVREDDRLGGVFGWEEPQLIVFFVGSFIFVWVLLLFKTYACQYFGLLSYPQLSCAY